MDNDSKVTALGSVKNISILLGAFGLPQISAEYQMILAQVLIVGYALLGIIKDIYTNKPDASLLEVLDRLATAVDKKE